MIPVERFPYLLYFQDKKRQTIILVAKEGPAEMVRLLWFSYNGDQKKLTMTWMIGACCPKETGQCNYGPKACGTNNISPNDVCWSNCDAKAECGRYSDPPNKECPLNVVCHGNGYLIE